MLSPFRNESFTDFSKPENRQKQEEALKRVTGQSGREYPLYIGGKDVTTGKTFKSMNPSHTNQVVGTFHKAGQAEVDLAMKAALEAFEKWRWVAPKERAIVLLKAAAVMRRRKLEVNAWMITEIGKSWPEADADTSEAIDFLEFYAREALRWSEVKGATPFPNEFPELNYIPLGVGAIIPPWNFPMAILTGMTAAAIVTGNTVLLK
ncbi:MAG TPA: aldehyde dehydrogenase family protein, partial [bacterium]|nr:aldehyde dehydrogenase family protein [bacterium]